jgi:hypothetical protein
LTSSCYKPPLSTKYEFERQIKDTKAGINSQAFFQQKWTAIWLLVVEYTFVVNGLYFSTWLGQTMLGGFIHFSILLPEMISAVSFH